MKIVQNLVNELHRFLRYSPFQKGSSQAPRVQIPAYRGWVCCNQIRKTHIDTVDKSLVAKIACVDVETLS